MSPDSSPHPPPTPISQPALNFVAFQTAPASQEMERIFMTLAGSLSAKSSHPVASSINRIATLNGYPHRPVIGFQDFAEKGFGGAVELPGEEGHRAMVIGTREFISLVGLDMPAILEVAARKWESEGARVLLGGWDGYVRGLLKFI